jgi:predicted Zn-dependent peptidase
MRMELGQVYYIEPCCYSDAYLGELAMGGNFSCASKNIDFLINIVTSDIGNMGRGKIDKDILAKAKKACKTRWEKGTLDNFTIAESYAYMSVYNKTDFNSWPFLFDKVTSEDLKNIASKVLSVDYFKVVLAPVKTKS